MDLSRYKELHKQLGRSERRRYAKAAIYSQFGLGDIEDGKIRHRALKAIEAFYTLAGDEAFRAEAEAANLMDLPCDRPVLGLTREAYGLVDELRKEQFVYPWPKDFTALRRELRRCIES